ncbi:MAG: hypothetical protein NTU53_08200 [Planctomycetota bacterium]|nr:hypothetical protein [Planctomycetota bacterium]
MTLISLRKGLGIEQLQNLPDKMPLIDPSPPLNTKDGAFMDTAAARAITPAAAFSSPANSSATLRRLPAPVNLALLIRKIHVRSINSPAEISIRIGVLIPASCASH